VSDLARAVDKLVETASSGAKGKALQKAVSAVVDAFDASDAKAAKAALAKLDKSVGGAVGHASQVLQLTIGALVEAGAPPEAAWPAVSRELEAALEGATRFAMACAQAAKTPHVETALAKVGEKIAKKSPRDAGAWEALPSRCLAAVACLTRSAKVRAAARKQGLLEEAYPLEDAVAEVGYLTQALRVLDDVELLVLHPEAERGFRVRVTELGSNAELFVLLADAVIGDPKKGFLPGDKFDRRAIAALTGNAEPPKGSALVAPFNFVAYTGLDADGSLPEPSEIEEHWIWFEGVPADIPEYDGTRIVLLQEAPFPRMLPMERSFEALSPKVQIIEKIPAAGVKKLLGSIAKTAKKPKRKARARR
jgi:predicted HAD superfamily Cof-like phosphohydrolase